MNRGGFEQLIDEFVSKEHTDPTSSCCLTRAKVRDFIWEELLGRPKCERIPCLNCGKIFPQSRADQKFHDPACKNQFFQKRRREREKGKKDYET